MGGKKSFSVFLFIMWAFSVTAQVASKCEVPFAAFTENVKSGNYDDALLQYKELNEKCPKVSDKLYLDTEIILNYKIEAARTKEETKDYVNNLLSLYAQFDKNFPGNKNSNDIKKALLLNEYNLASDDEVFKMLDASFKSNTQAFTNHKALEKYFDLFLKRYESGKSGISDKDFITKYNEISGQVLFAREELKAQQNELIRKQETQALSQEEIQFVANSKITIDTLTAISENINVQASRHFSCDKLEVYYAENFEKHKADSLWLEAMVEILYSNKCFNSAVLQNGAVVLFELKPSAGTALRLGTMAQKKNDLKAAVSYFDRAAELENTTEAKADLYYRIAGIFRNSDKKEAKNYVLKSAQFDAKSGKPYLFLAEMYSSVSASECNLSDFERKALLWLAIETVKKAEVVEPKYNKTVAALVKNYEKRMPEKNDVKAAGKKKGDKLVYGCWINETVTVPNI